MLLNLSGYVVSLPEKKVAKNGNQYYSFRIVHNEWRNGEDKPIFISCTLFGNLFDRIISKLNKGDAIDVQGDLTCNLFEVPSQTQPDKMEPRIGYNLMLNYIGYSQNGRGKSSSYINSTANNTVNNNPVPQPSIEIPKEYKSTQPSGYQQPNYASNDDDDLPF